MHAAFPLLWGAVCVLSLTGLCSRFQTVLTEGSRRLPSLQAEQDNNLWQLRHSARGV